MTLDLDKNDLIALVTGTSPYYDIMENDVVKKAGDYCGGMNDHWRWKNYALLEMSEEELFSLYQMCKNSWKK